jgi:1-acyl-sn-glycerol-3-phosphate acyltransferase
MTTSVLPLLTTFTMAWLKAVLYVYMKVYHRFEVVGRCGDLPSPPLIVLTNHVSALDGVAFILANPYVNLAFVGKASLLHVPIVGRVLHNWGMIPVDRSGEDIRALRAILRSLHEGRAVGVAAEGTRNRTGGIGDVHPVLAKLALSTNVPLLPVVVRGTYEALPPGAWFPLPKPVKVVFGRAFTLGELDGLSRDEAVERARQLIREHIIALLNDATSPHPSNQRRHGRGVGNVQ